MLKHKVTACILLTTITLSGCFANAFSDSEKREFHVGSITGPEILAQFDSFNQHKDDYAYSETEIAQLRTIAEPIEVKVFFGEWCHDSVREVPRLIELFKRADNNNISASFYALDTAKSDPEGQALKFNIKRTPTVIVYKNEVELGRFLEFPKTNWANDITTLASSK